MPPNRRRGGVEIPKELMYMINAKQMLPACIVQLIKSFLPKPPVPYVQVPCRYHSYDYMSIQDWCDTEDVRAYGDY